MPSTELFKPMHFYVTAVDSHDKWGPREIHRWMSMAVSQSNFIYKSRQ